MRRFFRGLFVLCDILLLAGFAVAYAARYVRPDATWWWLQLVAVGLPFLALLVVVATIVVFLMRGPGRTIHVVAFVLILIRFGLPLSGGGEARAGDLTVLSYNLPRYWGGVSDSVRAQQVVRFVRAAAPDAVAFQEAGALSLGDTLVVFNPHIALIEHTLGYRLNWPFEARYHYAHNNTLARFSLDRTDNLRLQLVPGEVYSELQRSYFRWQGRPAVIYNVHLRSYGRAKPWNDEDVSLREPRSWKPFLRQYREAILYRTVEADTVRALLARETMPVIVAGDLNSTAHNWAHRRVGEGLRDTFRKAGRGWGATYHVRAPVARIDFVLASPAWEIVAARVPDVALSDHKPLLVTLRWKDAVPPDSLESLPPDSIQNAAPDTTQPVYSLTTF